MLKPLRYSFLLTFTFLYSTYPESISQNGSVTSSNMIASEVGVAILEQGGNAIDAAIGVGFALSVVHPGAGNIGGGGFMVIRLSDGTITTIDFREKAPARAYRDMYLDDDGSVIPDRSWSTIHAVGVPGTVAGFGYAHEKYGLLSWKALLQPSILLAKNGFKLDPLNVSYFNSKSYSGILSNNQFSTSQFIDKRRYDIGDSFVQADLSNTLKRISKNGYKEFYLGKTSDLIVKTFERNDGLINHDDLKSYNPIEREPIHFTYRDYNIYSMPQPSSGGILLAEILNQIENYSFNSDNMFHSFEHIYIMAEAEKQAYADRAKYLGDPDFNSFNIKRLVTQEYADSLWSNISLEKRIDIEDIYNFSDTESEETTHYSVVDRWGNAVSVTTTLNGWFGTGIVVDGAGFLLNNEMDDFSSKPGHPNKYGLIGSEANSIEPSKRMLSSMSPTIVTDTDNDLFLVLGSPGGSTIITTVAQIIVNIIDFGMDIDDAISSNRFHHQFVPEYIYYEPNSFSYEVIEKLTNIGYKTVIRTNIGEANCIQFDKDKNLYYGTSDRRRNGRAIGY